MNVVIVFLFLSREQTCSRCAATMRRSAGPVWPRLMGLILFALTVSAWAQDIAKRSEAHLVLLDGSTAVYRSLSIDSGKLAGEGVPADLTLDDLRRIEPGGRGIQEGKGSAVVELGGGGRIPAKSVAIFNEKCNVESAGGQSFSLQRRALLSRLCCLLARFEMGHSRPHQRHSVRVHFPL